MDEKQLKARKDYLCSACNELIRTGEIYLFGKGKFARYENDKQVGITYGLWRLHIQCPVTPWYQIPEQLEQKKADTGRIPETEHYLNNYQDLPF